MIIPIFHNNEPMSFKFSTNFLLPYVRKPAKYGRHGSIGLDATPTVLIHICHPVHGCFFHSLCPTDLNFGTKNNGGMKYSTLKTVIFASYCGSPLVQFSKFKKFLWVCWFSCKNLSNFVSLPWKFHNPYCHNRDVRFLGCVNYFCNGAWNSHY